MDNLISSLKLRQCPVSRISWTLTDALSSLILLDHTSFTVLMLMVIRASAFLKLRLLDLISFNAEESADIRNLSCHQVIGGSTMVSCSWKDYTIKSSYLATIRVLSISPVPIASERVYCCEASFDGDGLSIGDTIFITVAKSSFSLLLEGRLHFKQSIQ